MSDALDPLIDHLGKHTALPVSQLRRVVDEIFAFCGETVEEYVLRRHRELARDGQKNAAIYRLLETEVRQRPFASRAPTQRQIRRMIYG